MTQSLLPSERKEQARAALRDRVVPHLNAQGKAVLDAFLENPVLKPGETYEDVALDITSQDNVIRTFKEGEIVAITALLEAFAMNKQAYLNVQATSPKARSVQDDIDALDAALFKGGADYTKLGQLIGGLRTLVTAPDQIDVIDWFKQSAKGLGVDLAPDTETAEKVDAALANIKNVLAAPSLTQKLAERSPGERALA